MPSQIEEIAEYNNGTKVWKTTCKCTGDDITFTVESDDDYSEVYLNVCMDVGDSYRIWEEDRPFRWIKCIWSRFKVAFKVIVKGYVEMNGSFIFRGENHIDEFTETIQIHKEHLIKRNSEIEFKETKENT